MIIELKAHAYDILAQIEMLQADLRNTNQKIAEEMAKVQKTPIEKPLDEKS